MDEKRREGKSLRKKESLPMIEEEQLQTSSNVAAGEFVRPSMRKSSSVKSSCLCSPTTHVGSFRCRLHRNAGADIRRGYSVGSDLSELAVAYTAAQKEGQN
ncbi:hypothetical protein Dimus_014437 [Dionaea muscipula]